MRNWRERRSKSLRVCAWSFTSVLCTHTDKVTRSSRRFTHSHAAQDQPGLYCRREKVGNTRCMKRDTNSRHRHHVRFFPADQ